MAGQLWLPVGFALLVLQGVSEIVKCVAALTTGYGRDMATKSRCNDRIRPRQHGAAHVRGPDPVHADRLSGRVLAAAVGLFFGLIGIELGLIEPEFLGNLVFQLNRCLANELLLAIPFFTLMGAILERCGLAEDLLEGFGQLFGGLRGGLSYAVIFVGAMLGAITGTVAASVIAMGLISLPVMMRYGYNIRHATGVIAASGTITQLIPPSLVLVVLADQLGKPVGDMYRGAFGASVVQVLLFCLV